MWPEIAWAALFFLCAAVQWNDPDPMRWIALYTAAASVCISSARRRVPPALHATVAVVAGVWACTLLPEIARLAEFTGNEVERELGGLVLVTLAMLHLRRRAAAPVIDSPR